MARQYNNARPKNLRYTVGKLLSYMGRHKLLLLLVAVLVTISALGNLLATYRSAPWSTIWSMAIWTPSSMASFSPPVSAS